MSRCEVGAPSSWVARWIDAVPPASIVLDVACGRGRHVCFLRDRGFEVVAVDRDEDALALLPDDARVRRVKADLESGPWPFASQEFGGVVVTNYLWRPLLPAITGAVAVGGVLLYETFRIGQEQFGSPRRAEFLLQPGELLLAVRDGFEVLGFEDGPDGDPPSAMRQRLCARRIANGRSREGGDRSKGAWPCA